MVAILSRFIEPMKKIHLSLIGLADTTDQTTIAANWGSWTQSQLQTWLNGTTTHGGPYSPTAGPCLKP